MMSKIYRYISENKIEFFKSKIAEACRIGTPIEGYKERRYQEFFLKIYGKGNYKIKNKSDVYIKINTDDWVHLCQIRIIPTERKSKLTLKEIAEKHCAVEKEEQNPEIEKKEEGKNPSFSFRRNSFHTPQLFLVPPQGLNYKKIKLECDWIIETDIYKKTGAQVHAKVGANK